MRTRFAADQGAGRSELEPGAVATAEAIASRDHNNLYLTSSFFADRTKYRAFCAYYALMRVVDDRVDEIPFRGPLARSQMLAEKDILAAWREGVRACYANGRVDASVAEACALPDAPLLFEAFADSLRDFRPPQALWDDFFSAMQWDLGRARFTSWREFLTYAEGASVAPTTIYLFLITARGSGGSTVLPEGFDLIECGRQLGLFAYLGHVLRDVAEDLRIGDGGLVYFSREDMEACGVTDEGLFSDLERGRASETTRSLVAELSLRARRFLAAGRASMTPLSGQLEKDCAFILELIVTMYERVIDKIEASGHDPMGRAHRLTPHEKQTILSEVAGRIGYRLDQSRRTNQQEH